MENNVHDTEAAAAVKKTPRIPLRITDTTLRDAHQSLWATRMRSKDILPIIETIDAAGFYSLEVWGGATFDVCLRFLRENPWERLRQIKAKATRTPLQMLLRGQNILGYKNYADDLLERFVALACQNGIDIFRIFDALNDNRNLEQAIKFVKKYGGHAQGTICYTISPVHTVREFVRIAREQVEMGIDSLCIKDMAGILAPISCRRLVTALRKEVRVPIQIHSHATSGMASATYVEGVVAGAGAIDCAISPMSGFSSQPPVETMLAIFSETSYHANLDIEALRKICRYFLELAPKRRPEHHPDNIIDPEILIHHIPGGMISNLRSQLQQQNALDRLNDVLAELPRVRADLGFPPLVTPTSQIVGVQASLNILAGERYKLVPQETKDYVKGLYGRSPAPIPAAIRKKILGDEPAVTCRPADLLQPALPQATMDVEPNLIKNEEDILSYCLFPEPALEFFKWRNLPIEERPSPPADLELKKQEALARPPAPAPAAPAPATPLMTEQDYREIEALVDKVHTLGLSELTIRRDDLTLSLKGSGLAVSTEPAPKSPAPAAKSAAPAKAANSGKAAPAPAPAAQATTAAPARGPCIEAPLNGTFYTSGGPGKPAFVKEGDKVKAGDPVCIVEAMKLFNPIKATQDCRIVKRLVEHGALVQKGQALFEVESA
jgi:oxaloacetate decarboxylase alpha subunit